MATKSTLDKAVDCGEQNEKTMEVEQMQSNRITTVTSKVKDIGPDCFVCQGCGKEFVRIFKHFEKSPLCKPLNDVAFLELRMKEKRKEAKRETKAQSRAIASPAKMQKEKEAHKEQMAQARAIASPAKKQKEKEANKV